jgi:hypothetical protein
LMDCLLFHAPISSHLMDGLSSVSVPNIFPFDWWIVFCFSPQYFLGLIDGLSSVSVSNIFSVWLMDCLLFQSPIFSRLIDGLFSFLGPNTTAGRSYCRLLCAYCGWLQPAHSSCLDHDWLHK